MARIADSQSADMGSNPVSITSRTFSLLSSLTGKKDSEIWEYSLINNSPASAERRKAEKLKLQVEYKVRPLKKIGNNRGRAMV